MKTTVIYYSKTGNTQMIADAIATAVGGDARAINLRKRGKKTKQEREEEQQMVKNAIEYCNQSDVVFIGTPTEFRKPHAKIVDVIKRLSLKRAAIFCTYYGMLGATLYDVEALLLQQGISIINTLNVRVGTKKYTFSLNVSQYQDKITAEHLQAARDFALRTVAVDTPLPVRLTGICGVDCHQCQALNRSCNGAGYACWSGSQCQIFECCVIKKSYVTCGDCEHQFTYNKMSNIPCNVASSSNG